MSYIVDQGRKDKQRTQHPAASNRGFMSMGIGHQIFGTGNVTRQAASQMFKTIDDDNSGKICQQELTDWCVHNKLFMELNKADAHLTACRLFNDIDTDRSGSLEVEEFFQFLQMVQREHRTLNYANKHHLTQLPASIKGTNMREFSLPMIETMLQEKIQQLTSKDSDRYRQVLTLFKHQVQRSGGTRAQHSYGPCDDRITMTLRDFNTFLSILGLFATREQAEQLFRRYDANGDGILTVHEFFSKASQPDYPGISLTKEDRGYDFRNKRGKKMFNNTSRYGIPVKVSTPDPAIYDMGTQSVHLRIRERLEQTARTGIAFTDQQARRKLFSAFEDKDPMRMGRVSPQDFQHQLERRIGVIMTGPHMRALCAKYGDEGGLIKYPELVMDVYPNNQKRQPTSLYRSHLVDPSRASRAPSRMQGRTRGPKPQQGRAQMRVTGAYWQIPRNGQDYRNSRAPPTRSASVPGLVQQD